MSSIRKLYEGFCERIYSVGKVVAERRRVAEVSSRARIDVSAKIYQSADIVNLQNRQDAIVIGKSSHILGQLVVLKRAGKITIGEFCSVGDMSRIVSGLDITIGNRVMIAHNVNVLDNNSHPTRADLRHQDFVDNYSGRVNAFDLACESVTIEDDVWIGFNSTILKGVKIGQGAIIGAGSMVLNDIEPWTVNVGNPLRVVRRLEPVKVV